MEVLWYVLVLLVLFGATVYLQVLFGNFENLDEQEVLTHDDKIDRWESIADRLGLRHVANYPKERLRLEGTVDGVDVTIRRITHANFGATKVEVELTDLLPDDFAMYAQETSSYVDRLVDREDILVGNERLDAAFVFHGLVNREVKSFVWQEGLEEHLLELRELSQRAKIVDGIVEETEPGIIPEPAEIEGDVRQLVDWANRLAALAEGEGEVSSAADTEWDAPG